MNDQDQPLLKDMVVRFLEEEEWPYQQVIDPEEAEVLIETVHRGQQGEWLLTALVRESEHLAAFFITPGWKVPSAQRAAAAEYFTRANNMLKIGFFSIDMDEGDFRFTITVDATAHELNTTIIRAMVYTGLQAMEVFLPGVMRVVYGGQLPGDSILQHERGLGPLA